MTIEESLIRLAPYMGWFRAEVCDPTVQDYFGYPKPCYAALTKKTPLEKPVEVYGDTLQEALELLVERIEGLDSQAVFLDSPERKA